MEDSTHGSVAQRGRTGSATSSIGEEIVSQRAVKIAKCLNSNNINMEISWAESNTASVLHVVLTWVALEVTVVVDAVLSLID